MSEKKEKEGTEPVTAPSPSKKTPAYRLVGLAADVRQVYVPQTGREYDLTKELHPAEAAQLLEVGWEHIEKDE